MNHIYCDCITQPLYSMARWLINKGCTPQNKHQNITQECEEEKLEKTTTHHQSKINLTQTNHLSKKEPIIPLKDKIDIPIPKMALKTPKVQRSFEDEILLKDEENEKDEDREFIKQKQHQITSFKLKQKQLGQYYELFSTKTSNLDEKFNLKGTQLQLDQSPGDLEVSFIESQNLNIFMYSFTLPCSFHFYSKMMQDYDLQKQLDPNIEEYKVQQVISPQAKISYIAYKKVLIVSPRDFVSLKYRTSCNQDHWQVAISVPSPPTPNKVRGDIILHAVLMKQSPGKKELRVKVYSEINMKLSVRPKLTKNQSLTEIRKYVQRCLKYIVENPQN